MYEHEQTTPFSPADHPDNQKQEDLEGSSTEESTALDEKKMMDELRNEITSLKDQLLRTIAESENTRKRFLKEREETSKFAIHSFARDMVSVADNLRLALKTSEADEKSHSSSIVGGIQMTEKELLKNFEKHGIIKISPQKGDPFDHNIHQAMFEVETGEFSPGSIFEVIQEGYRLHERLIRPALVGVSKEKMDA